MQSSRWSLPRRWLLVLSLGLLCAPGSYGQTAGPKPDSETQQRSAVPLKVIVTSLPDVRDPGCGRGSADRHSELCAQWVAADAAARAATAAEKQAYWSVAGFFALLVTLLASAWAAWVSTRAALAAEQSVKIAEDTSKIQLRAFISVRPVEIDDLTLGRVPVLVRLPVENTGATPASNYTIRHAWQVTEEEPSSELFDRLLAAYPSTPRQHSMGPHQLKTITFELNLGADFRARVLDETATLYFLGEITYRDVFGSNRKTEFFYRYRKKYPEFLSQVSFRNVIE